MKATKFTNGAIVVHRYDPDHLHKFFRLVFELGEALTASAVRSSIPPSTAGRLYAYYLHHSTGPSDMVWTRNATRSDRAYQASIYRQIFRTKGPIPTDKEEPWEVVIPRLIRRGGRIEKRGLYTFIVKSNGEDYMLPRQVVRRLSL
jgi:hypothetical protein